MDKKTIGMIVFALLAGMALGYLVLPKLIPQSEHFQCCSCTCPRGCGCGCQGCEYEDETDDEEENVYEQDENNDWF